MSSAAKKSLNLRNSEAQAFDPLKVSTSSWLIPRRASCADQQISRSFD
jgi:hypothetical protein